MAEREKEANGMDEGSSNSATSSSSRTAREDGGGGSAGGGGGGPRTEHHADQTASIEKGDKDTVPTPAIHHHGPNNNAETVSSTFASHKDPHDIGKGHGDDQKPENRTIVSALSSSMTSSVNTIPVFARRHRRTYDTRTQAAMGDKDREEDRKADSQKNDEKEQVPSGGKRGETNNDDRHSVAASTFDDGDSDADGGPRRFWSFTMRGPRSPAPQIHAAKIFAAAAASETDERGHAAEESRATESRGAKLSNLLTNFRAKSHGSSSVDDENVGRPEMETHPSTYEGDKQMPGANEGARGGWSHDESNESRDLGAKRTSYDASISRNFPKTPGWHSPWRPESPGEHSIRFGKYRFNNFGEGSYFPRTDTKRSAGGGEGRKKSGGSIWTLLTDMEWWTDFLLHNTFVPLLFRLINIGFTACTLAVAIKLWQILRSEGAEDAVGSSPILAIIFCPLTLLHVGIQIYLEYFSRPIGIWRVGSKLFYTLIELIFICLWSAELSLAFDNYFTSTLICSSFNSPYVRQVDNNPAFGGQQLNDPGRKPYICRLQGALIGLVFTSLLAYVIVLTLSLFRIFIRVSKR